MPPPPRAAVRCHTPFRPPEVSARTSVSPPLPHTTFPFQGPHAAESPRPQAERHSKLGAHPRASPRVPMSCASSTQDTVGGVYVTQAVALRAASCGRRLPSCPCSLWFTVCPRVPPCDAARLRVPPRPPHVEGRCLSDYVANLNDGSPYYMRGVDSTPARALGAVRGRAPRKESSGSPLPCLNR